MTWLFLYWPLYVPCKHVFSLGPMVFGKIHVYRAHAQVNTKKTM